MEQYISKSALVAEIVDWRDKIKKGIFSIPLTGSDRAYATFEYEILGKVRDSIDTLETKEVDTWHLQEKENIYDAVKDWGLYTFACIMKDGTIQKFTGNLDEDCEGHINVHIDGVNDDYDNVDDIVKWIEIT